MKNKKIKRLIINLKTLIIYGTLGALALGLFFYTLVGAILQTSYRMSPVTPEEMNMEVLEK